jgi:hypothetical protein
MIYCVVPEELAGELLERLSSYYADDPNVTVIVDRRKRARRSAAATTPAVDEQRERRDRRRPRVPGELPAVTPPLDDEE